MWLSVNIITIIPHFDEISKNLCDSWNKMHMEQYFNGILKDKVVRRVMTGIKALDDCCFNIITDFVPGFRLSEKRRNVFWEQMDAQMSDGWGEGNLGPANLMKFADGTYGFPY